MEVLRRSDQSRERKRLTHLVHFDDVRSDWYAANTLLPRLIVNAVLGRKPLRLVGFPLQWISVCVYYGIHFNVPQAPLKYLPIFSDVSPRDVRSIAKSAERQGASRAFLEAVAALDPVIADLVYIVDHKLAAAGHTNAGTERSNLLNTWHSFGRPEIVRLQERMCRHIIHSDSILLLPCSRRRPYSESNTHTRIAQKLTEAGYNARDFSQVVVTALGVIPSQFWRHPIVMTYDAGAVDLWRVFQLLRAFFAVNRTRTLIDCLSFKPYSDMLNTLHLLQSIPAPLRPLKLRWRGFHVALP